MSRTALVYVLKTNDLEILTKKLWKNGYSLIVPNELYHEFSIMLGLISQQGLIQKSQRLLTISDYTNNSSILKENSIFHPRIYGGILKDPKNIQDTNHLIDLLIVNFGSHVTSNDVGCSLIRFACRNWKNVLILSDNSDYHAYLTLKNDEKYEDKLGKMKLNMAIKAFRLMMENDRKNEEFLLTFLGPW